MVVVLFHSVDRPDLLLLNVLAYLLSLLFFIDNFLFDFLRSFLAFFLVLPELSVLGLYRKTLGCGS